MHDSPTPAPPPVDDELDRLTRRRAIHSLQRTLGEDAGRAAWSAACLDAGVDADRPLPLDALARVASRLANDSGPASLVGSSLAIRVRTYQMLTQARRLERFLGGNHGS
ncbi:MAG: hypothetical protein AAGC60_09035 [Acidobacteriota bacterium]